MTIFWVFLFNHAHHQLKELFAIHNYMVFVHGHKPHVLMESTGMWRILIVFCRPVRHDYSRTTPMFF